MSLKQFFLLLFFSSNILPFTIMIDPSGDAKHAGRDIHDTFERGVTLQCAEQLKKDLYATFPDIRVVLTRVPGETIHPLQNASFANRLQVDFYLSIYFYAESEIPRHLSFFYYRTSQTDTWHNPITYMFYHVYQAHLINIKQTEEWGKLFLQSFEDSSLNAFFKVEGLFGIPFKPLMGIKAPAIALEAGLQQIEDWKYLIKPTIAVIRKILHA